MIVHMIGNAHLQPSGLWSLHSGKDEVIATFRAAADRCEEFPLYRFSFGEIWAYEFVKRVDPKLFKRIRKLVKRKQWDLSHGMYTLVNPETVTPSLFERIVKAGHEFCEQNFGYTPEIAVNFEASSYSTSALNALIDAGYKGLVYHGDFVDLGEGKSSIFRWQNDEGQELLCYKITPGYRTRSSELYGQIIESVESASLALGHTLCLYGLGDHGGGPNKGNIEYIIERKDDFDGTELKFSTYDTFFSDAFMMSDSFPVYKGNIGEKRIGHYSASHHHRQARVIAESNIIQATRIAEDHAPKRMYRQLETALNDAWKDLMLASSACFSNGTTIHAYCRSADLMVSRAELNAQELIYDISRGWARENIDELNFQQIIVINTSHDDNRCWVELEPNLDFDEWGERCLCDEDGKAIPIQLIRSQSANSYLTRIIFQANIPARSSRTYHIREFSLLEEKPVQPSSDETFRLLKTTVENDLLTVRYSARALTRVSLKNQDATNLLGRLGMSFALYEDQINIAGTNLITNELPFVAGIESEGWIVVEEGEQRVTLVNTGHIGNSSFKWFMQLYRGDDRVYHKFQINYNESEKLLRLDLQLDEEVQSWTSASNSRNHLNPVSEYDIPFHGWSKAVSENSSFAILSRDIFSAIHQGQTVSMTLLRSPLEGSSESADRDFLTQTRAYLNQGVQEFEFILYPNASNYDMDSELDRLKNPNIVIDRYDTMNRPSWGNSTPERLQEKNETRARKDGQMSHLSN